MKSIIPVIFTFIGNVFITAGLLVSHQAIAAEKGKTPLEQGKELTISLCQACHQFEGTSQAGTAGPPLLAMKQRFPDSKKLYDIIYDPHAATKPHTMMPPFGRNGLVDGKQIELIIHYLYTL